MIWRELTTGIYPWDIHDEGIEKILDNLQEYAGNNAAYMLALMHHEKRPLHANYYPHNPVRKRYLAEDSRVYFTIHPEMYKNSRIKPLPTEREFLKDTDWLAVFIKALRKRGMKTGAEISHTPLDSERGRKEFGDCIQRDVYGNPPPYDRFTYQQLCWNSPDAREYVYSLARDLAAHYDLDMIQTCSFLYNPGRLDLHPFLGVSLGGCFCDNCKREAEAQGIDFEAMRSAIKKWADLLTGHELENIEDRLMLRQGNSTSAMFLLEDPLLYQWLRFRCGTVTRYLKGLSEAIHSVNKKIDFRFNTCWQEQELIGQNLREIAPYVDSIRMMDYSEQTGSDEIVSRKGLWLANVRRQAGEGKTIIGGIAPRAKASPELIRKGIRIVALGGADGLSYGFYDGAKFENLKAIREAMEECEIILSGSKEEKT
ncbi:MAG: hypothetical protein LBK83_06540 [Treponema sp.]|jgi:hypothetical protein|nr:hypothetical protein [Treponema sp.]